MWNRIIDLFHHNVVNLKRDKEMTKREREGEKER